jgi:soluble lytic murein transglycosylase-like protein
MNTCVRRFETVTLAIGICLMCQHASAQSEAIKRQIESAKKQAATVSRLQTAKQPAQVPWLAEREPDLSENVAECDPIEPEELQTLVAGVADEVVSSQLISAVIRQESANRPCAVSVKGAMGLMQLMPDVAREFAVDDPFDPRQNVEAGVRYLGQLLRKYNQDLPRALAAYNAGPARVDAANGIPNIAETQSYVKNILARLQSGAGRT